MTVSQTGLADLLVASPASGLQGSLAPSPDKSISHRALILAAMADGGSDIEALLESADVMATARAMRAFGAGVERCADGLWRVQGQGRLARPVQPIDCGNSGTLARLMLGAAAGFPLEARFTGDELLRTRPMGRVLEPLIRMGAKVLQEGPTLPVTIAGGGLEGIAYAPPQASAQVKSAILLAGLNAEGETAVTEAQPTRDHTERMLRAFGAEVTAEETAAGRRACVAGGQRLQGCRLRVPGDPSSAAFPLVAALVTPGACVTVEGVLLNPLRTGLLETLREMGARIEIVGEREEAGEQVGDVTARSSDLVGAAPPPARAPSMIDEYPILAIAAAFARGETVMRGLGELRLKESDRIARLARGLERCGVEVLEEEDGLVVRGAGAPPRGGASIATGGDHRIAMAFLVLGLAAREAVAVDGGQMIGTSYPAFLADLAALGARVRPA